MARTPQPRTRARDIDRVNVCNRLDAAYAEGMLAADEYHDRLALARTATTLATLAELVRDLQDPEASPLVPAPADIPPPRTSRRRTLIAAAGAVVVIGAVGTIGLLRTGDGPEAAGPSVLEPADLPAPAAAVDGDTVTDAASVTVDTLTVDGATGFRERYRAEFGDVVAHDLALYPSYAIVSRPDPERRDRLDVYEFVGEFTATSGRTRGAGTAPIDLDAVDVAGLIAAVEQAPATIGVPDGAVRHVLLADSGTPAASIYAYDAAGVRGGYVRTDLSGNVVQVVPAP